MLDGHAADGDGHAEAIIWIGISTGYRKIGLLYQKWRDHFGHDGDDVLVVQGPSSLFNSSLDLGMIERATAADPEAAESEWGGGFRGDINAFLSDDVIERAIDYARPLELPPRNLRYTAFADPSGGRHDAFTLCIGHKEGESFARIAASGTNVPIRTSPRCISKRCRYLCAVRSASRIFRF